VLCLSGIVTADVAVVGISSVVVGASPVSKSTDLALNDLSS